MCINLVAVVLVQSPTREAHVVHVIMLCAHRTTSQTSVWTYPVLTTDVAKTPSWYFTPCALAVRVHCCFDVGAARQDAKDFHVLTTLILQTNNMTLPDMTLASCTLGQITALGLGMGVLLPSLYTTAGGRKVTEEPVVRETISLKRQEQLALRGGDSPLNHILYPACVLLCVRVCALVRICSCTACVCLRACVLLCVRICSCTACVCLRACVRSGPEYAEMGQYTQIVFTSTYKHVS